VLEAQERGTQKIEVSWAADLSLQIRRLGFGNWNFTKLTLIISVLQTTFVGVFGHFPSKVGRREKLALQAKF
jgi:hypothetical protein